MFSTLQKQYDKRAYLGGLANRLIHPGERFSLTKSLSRIEKLGPALERASDSEIREQAAFLRRRLSTGEVELSSVVESAFALVREVSRRTTGLFPYPEQCLAGLALTRGCIAEQATGEGKTLTTTLPACCFGLTGKGVHVVTVNSYLARRDFDFAKPLFEFLGLTVGFLDEEAPPESKREIYRHDIIYGTGYEFGFDYLRDQIVLMDSPPPSNTEKLLGVLTGAPALDPSVMHRSLHYVIVDEVDSVMIDEADSPLVISQRARDNEYDPEPVIRAREVAETLVDGADFLIDAGRVILTGTGSRKAHEEKDIPWLKLRRPWKNYIVNALVARHLFDRDIHYIVKEEAIVIVDEFTGRAHEERSWREGLHQAVECKEGVPIQPETESAANITRQRFYSRYDTVCGLTGTATESAGEFWHFYRLPVVRIPLHRPCIRKILPERIFKTGDQRDDAIIRSVEELTGKGQPILIGTRNIRVSESLGERLRERGLTPRILTAKQDAEENEIIANAGQPGNIVIATNMAGRGTHIDLTEDSIAAGGLHVIAVERNDSLRIDRQLIGRCARQGEPGSSQSFVCAEDEIVSTYGKSLARILRGAPEDPLTGEISGQFSVQFDKLQQKVERLKYNQRLALAERDRWIDQTRQSLS